MVSLWSGLKTVHGLVLGLKTIHGLLLGLKAVVGLVLLEEDGNFSPSFSHILALSSVAHNLICSRDKVILLYIILLLYL